MDDPAIPESLAEVASLIGDDATRVLMHRLAGRTVVFQTMPRKLIEMIGQEHTAVLVHAMGAQGVYFANIRKHERRMMVISLKTKGLSASEAAEETGLSERRIHQVWRASR